MCNTYLLFFGFFENQYFFDLVMTEKIKSNNKK